MKIRIATIEDIPGMMALDRASPTAAHWSERQYRELLEQEVSATDKLVLAVDAERASTGETARQDGQTLAGFLVARGVQSEWELENIVVAAGVRRRGLAKRLLEDLLARIRRAGGSVFLEVRESNTAARSLYEKAGFREAGRRKSYYVNPSEDAVQYRQRLG